MTDKNNVTPSPVRWLMPDGSCTADRKYGEGYGGKPLFLASKSPVDLPDVLSAMLWLYHRLPRAYGRVGVIEAPITNVAKAVGTTVDVEFTQREGQ